jgi:hypothetical protein
LEAIRGAYRAAVERTGRILGATTNPERYQDSLFGKAEELVARIADLERELAEKLDLLDQSQINRT